jgi:predicted HAD superfamily Cof-like phosphohydrolase
MGRSIDLLINPQSPSTSRQLEFDLDLPPRLEARRQHRRGTSEAMQAVAEFHVAFDLPLKATPFRGKPEDVGSLRVELLREEFEEFKAAVEKQDVVAIADALGDIIYVAYGSALTFGIDLDAVLREVHRANMSKLGPDGMPVMREDGKVLKPATYSPPAIERVLLDQPPLFLD